ncbi:MAG: hypothetical protein FWF77_01215 [Defluviitaleaceae bacterium]|nr:hypothetical protein [Defluviitaleaceae bacterium]
MYFILYAAIQKCDKPPRSGHRGHMPEATHAPEATRSFPASHPKKTSRRVSLADSF